MQQAQFKHVADFGVLVVFGDALSDAAHDAVLALDQALSADMPEGAIELVPALVNLMVVFDPLITDHGAVQAHVERHLAALKPVQSTGATRRVDVCYEGEFGPDVDAVAQETGLSREAVINAHLGARYKVLMFGFAPGYGYMGGVPEALQLPRKTTPLMGMPKGAVMIAGPQCLVTTLQMPSGWHIIGRSPTEILTQDPDRPTLFGVGDEVVFNRISRDEFDRLSQGQPA